MRAKGCSQSHNFVATKLQIPYKIHWLLWLMHFISGKLLQVDIICILNSEFKQSHVQLVHGFKKYSPMSKTKKTNLDVQL